MFFPNTEVLNMLTSSKKVKNSLAYVTCNFSLESILTVSLHNCNSPGVNLACILYAHFFQKQPPEVFCKKYCL